MEIINSKNDHIYKFNNYLDEIKQSFLFYHTVIYNIEDNLQSAEMDSHKSIYNLIDNASITKWVEGLSLVYKHDINTQLTKQLYEDLRKKYNFHITVVYNESINKLRIEKKQDDIFIHYETKLLYNNLKLKKTDNLKIEEVGNMPNLVSVLKQKIINLLPENDVFLLIKNQIEEDITLNTTLNNSIEFDSDFKKVIFTLLLFLVPTPENQRKYYSVFVPCSYSYDSFNNRIDNFLQEIVGAGIIVFFKTEPDKKLLAEIDIHTIKWANRITIDSIKKIVTKAAQKSAIAAIMSRNMSHNLGSHIISGTKSEIAKSNYELNRKEALGAYRLLQYIQERMDFLSVVINHDKYQRDFNSPLNLKADILDEFAVDGRGNRHTNSEDLTHSYLLNHIVSSEKITRENNSGNNLKIEIELLKKEKDGQLNRLKRFTSLANGDNNSNEFNEINFSVPLGVNSRHAFLTILENYIRNIGKHKTKQITELILLNQQRNVDNKLLISILVENINSEYRITVFDNLIVDRNTIDQLNERINLTKKDWNLTSNDNGSEHVKILNEDNSLNKYNKGLKEMLICTAWLKGQTSDWSLIEKKEQELLKFVSLAIEPGKDVTIENGTIKESLHIRKIKETNAKKCYSGITFRLPSHYYYYYQKIENENEIDRIVEQLPSAEIYIIDININLEEKIKRIIHKVVFFVYLKDIKFKLEIAKNTNKKDNLKTLYTILYGNKFLNRKIIINYNCNIPSQKENSEKVTRTGMYHPGINYLEKLKKATNPLFFTSHNDSPSIFVQNIKILNQENLINKIQYLEGISGGNFTYNLLCNAPINIIQYYRIIETSLTKIAIIDERIIKRYKEISFGEEAIHRKRFTQNEVEILNDLLKCYKNNEIDFNFIISARNYLLKDFLLSIGIENRANAQKSWLKNTNLIEINPTESYNKLWLRKKNIFLYNSNDNGQLIDIEDTKIERIEQVDFLSIHYGILEKLGKISSISSFKEFLQEIGVDVYKTKVCIHSGRGGVVQLQDKVTFISLSSIDAQMDDSKYKISQMFINLKYKAF